MNTLPTALLLALGRFAPGELPRLARASVALWGRLSREPSAFRDALFLHYKRCLTAGIPLPSLPQLFTRHPTLERALPRVLHDGATFKGACATSMALVHNRFRLTLHHPVTLAWQLTLFRGSPISHVQFAPDGKRFVLTDATTVSVFDCATGMEETAWGALPWVRSGVDVRAALVSSDRLVLARTSAEVTELWQIHLVTGKCGDVVRLAFEVSHLCFGDAYCVVWTETQARVLNYKGMCLTTIGTEGTRPRNIILHRDHVFALDDAGNYYVWSAKDGACVHVQKGTPFRSIIDTGGVPAFVARDAFAIGTRQFPRRSKDAQLVAVVKPHVLFEYNGQPCRMLVE